MAVDEVFPELSLTIHSAISSWVSMSLVLLFPQTDRDESGFQGVCGFTLMVYGDIEFTKVVVRALVGNLIQRFWSTL